MGGVRRRVSRDRLVDAPELEPVAALGVAAAAAGDGTPALVREFSSVNRLPDELRALPAPSGVRRVPGELRGGG